MINSLWLEQRDVTPKNAMTHLDKKNENINIIQHGFQVDVIFVYNRNEKRWN